MKIFYAVALLVSMQGSSIAFADKFDTYKCTDDCSGHQEGYDWAKEEGVDDEESCSDASQSFNEGCRSFVHGGSGVITPVDEDEDEDEDGADADADDGDE
ncbi:hypothetical protein [Pseudomonas sp. PDM31]|uniref:hypothetical protein n=1 Tax=Pseudomonas sp. PDM31 TaxID=2854778 RepID=UPI002109EC9C|nr:hypothetical protein [Pseudomonas sp. PDM31]